MQNLSIWSPALSIWSRTLSLPSFNLSTKPPTCGTHFNIGCPSVWSPQESAIWFGDSFGGTSSSSLPKNLFDQLKFFTASSASVRTSLFTTVEAAAKERMEANAGRTRRRWDNIIPLQKFYISLHLETQIRPLSLSGGWSGLMVRHFPSSLNDPAPPKLSQDILEIP